jgi:hypothetical protein
VAASDLEARLKRAEAYEGIRHCIYSYALAGDRGNDSAIVARVFTEDASYEAAGMGRFVGRKNIIEGLAEIAKSAVLWAFHVPGGPLIDLAHDAMSAKAFWWAWIPVSLKGADGKPVPHWGAGHYNADLVDDGGVWKFKRVLFETKLRTPFDGPWTQIDGPFEWPK